VQLTPEWQDPSGGEKNGEYIQNKSIFKGNDASAIEEKGNKITM
jgi:hypothetical protein